MLEQFCPVCGDTILYVVYELADGSQELSHGSCMHCKYTDHSVKKIVKEAVQHEEDIAS
jgi:hypothetical protein